MASLSIAIQSAGASLSGTETVDAPRIFQHDRSREYAGADAAGKKLISESIGEQGRKRLMMEYEREVGKLVQRLGFRGRYAPQGPDSSYWSLATGKYLVVEAKGGNSQAKLTFGAKQGTNLNTVRSAASYLSSKGASFNELVKHAEIIEAAIRDVLETGVARTTHKNGKPSRPKFDGGFDDSSVSRAAKEIKEKQIRRNPDLKKVYDQASQNVQKLVWQHRVGTALAGIGLVAGLAVSWDAYVAWKRVAGDLQYGVEDDTKFALALAQATSRTAEGAVLSASSAARIALAMGYKGGRTVSVARVAGRAVLPVVIVTEFAYGGEAIYDHYFRHETSTLEFYAAASGPAITVVFTASGAFVGALVCGVPTGGAGVGPGALFGAEVGAFISVPFVLVNNYIWGRFFDGQALRVSQGVDEAVRRMYR